MLVTSRTMESIVSIARQTTDGDDLRRVVDEATTAPNVVHFGELLRVPQVQQMDDVRQLVTLFAYGTWQQYESQRTKLQLSDAQERKLKCLTLLTACQNRQSIPYIELCELAHIPSIPELEHMLIHDCIYPGFLVGRLDQKAQTLRIHSTVPRDVSDTRVDDMIGALHQWLDTARKVSYFLEEQQIHVDTVATKLSAKKMAMEQEKKYAHNMVTGEAGKHGERADMRSLHMDEPGCSSDRPMDDLGDRSRHFKRRR